MADDAAVARYATFVYANFGVSLYRTLKFRSLERAAYVSESSYGADFYLSRIVPKVLLFGALFSAGFLRRK